MEKVYDAQHVDGILKAASDAMHAVTERAAAIEKERNTLLEEVAQLKQAAQEKVELEKVAAPHVSALEAGTVNTLVDMLVSREMISEAQREKYAAACMDNANDALKVAMRALELSDAPASQGRGIKSAASSLTARESDLLREEEAWQRVAEERPW